MDLYTTVSIIICTRNRAESLKPTLESISQTNVPRDWKIELLVVDNGSTDQTQKILSEMLFHKIRFRYIREATLGKCYACNTGLKETSGSIILFTDDDVRVPADWIEKMCRPIMDKKAEAVQGGVRLAPHLERPWLTGALRIWVGAVEHMHKPPEGLVGANMAFTREALSITGGFDVRLGPGAAGFYDDTLFGWTLVRAGKPIFYLPCVFVEHHFDPIRLRLGAYLTIARGMATSRAIAMEVIEPLRPRPAISDLLVQIPGLFLRCLTQIARFFINGAPDPGFLVRYHQFCLWKASRNKYLVHHSLMGHCRPRL